MTKQELISIIHEALNKTDVDCERLTDFEQDTDEIVMRTVAHSTIDSMRSNKKANIGLNHLRKGGIGGWRDTFTVSQSELFDKVYARKMAESGLVFDFGEGLVM